MAPRGGGRGRGRGGGGGDGPDLDKCRGCNRRVDSSTYGLDEPAIAAALAFKVIALVVLIVLWFMSWKIRSITEVSSPRRYLRNSAFVFYIISYLLGIIQLGVQESIIVRASFRIIETFVLFFLLFGDIMLFYNIYKGLRTRFASIPDQGLYGLFWKYGKTCSVATTILFLLSLAAISIEIRSEVVAMRYYVPSIPSSIEDQILDDVIILAKVFWGFWIAIRVVQLLVGVFILVVCMKLRDAQKLFGIQSRIVSMYFYLIWPTLLVRNLAHISILLARITENISSRYAAIASTWSYQIPSVVLFAGIVWVGLQLDWPIDLGIPEWEKPTIKEDGGQKSNDPLERIASWLLNKILPRQPGPQPYNGSPEAKNPVSYRPVQQQAVAPWQSYPQPVPPYQASNVQLSTQQPPQQYFYQQVQQSHVLDTTTPQGGNTVWVTSQQPPQQPQNLRGLYSPPTSGTVSAISNSQRSGTSSVSPRTDHSTPLFGAIATTAPAQGGNNSQATSIQAPHPVRALNSQWTVVRPGEGPLPPPK